MNAIKKNIIIFGGVPPPVTGAAVSNQLVNDILKETYNVFLLNTSVGYIKPKNNLINNLRYSILTIFIYLKRTTQIASILNKHKIHAFYFLPSCNILGHIKDSIILFLFGSRLGKIIGQIHNSNFKFLFEKKIYKLFTYNFYSKISLLIFSSKNLSDECGIYISAERRIYFYNTINPQVFCTNEELNVKLSSKCNFSKFKILFVNHMLFSKGCFDLLKSAYLLKMKGMYDFEITFVGGWIDTQEKNEFNQFLEKNKMEDYVNCMGIIRDPNILKRQYLESDIFILPTYYPYESQPLSIIDAMNAGNPIISTDHGTISEFVKSEINGYIVDMHSPQQICESIEKLMDRAKWLEMAKQARKDFLEKFSHEIYKDNLLNIFQ